MNSCIVFDRIKNCVTTRLDQQMERPVSWNIDENFKSKYIAGAEDIRDVVRSSKTWEGNGKTTPVFQGEYHGQRILAHRCRVTKSEYDWYAMFMDFWGDKSNRLLCYWIKWLKVLHALMQTFCDSFVLKIDKLLTYLWMFLKISNFCRYETIADLMLLLI